DHQDHNQIVMLDLGKNSAVVDPNWNTQAFTSLCDWHAFGAYVEDVDFAPDGSWFAIATTGGSSGAKNSDGTRSTCDAASRWETDDTGSNVRPTWIDYSGNDTFWSVAVTGTAVYLGGHARWMNNPQGANDAAPGAVPRPGIVALDPVNGLPFAWNPGRNPRGGGARALLATPKGLWVGSDTNWIGNKKYNRKKIAYFPLAGGYTPASQATTSLPADLFLAGPLPGGTTGATSPDLDYRSFDGTTAGPEQSLTGTGVDWSATRGAFEVGGSLFWDGINGKFYTAPLNGTTVGPHHVVNPYDDPAWSHVGTGRGQTYRGVLPSYYAEMTSVTGQFFADGRLYYTLAGQPNLYWRYFEPDDGVIGETENGISGVDFSHVQGMTISGSTIYWADSTDGTLHSVPFSDNTLDPSGATVVASAGTDWRAENLFVAPGAG
ncbi:MAG: hypothetical protein INR72_18260, partial [Williamsia herbipolensis]|nr:hypothetical protein [Williamsia herbipolensis]